jgi:hypothetical protein
VLEKGTPLFIHPERFGITTIYDRRSEGAMQLVRFDTKSGFTATQAQAAEKVLRNTPFQHITPFSQLLGSLWDHAQIVYSKLPRPVARAPLPDMDAVMAAVRDVVGDVE